MTLNVSDADGRTASCSSNSIIIAVETPAIACNVTAGADSVQQNAEVTFTAALSASGSVTSILGTEGFWQQSPAVLVSPNTYTFTAAFSSLGNQTVTVNVSDTKGNFASCSSNSIRVDPSTSPPSGPILPKVSSLAALSASNVYEIDSSTGQVRLAFLNSGGQWDSQKLTVTSNPNQATPALTQIVARDDSGLVNIYGIRSDNGLVNQWQRSNNQWVNGDLVVSNNPSNHGTSWSQMVMLDRNNVFGIRSDNGLVNAWWYVEDSTSPKHGWNNSDLSVTANPSNHGPALKAIDGSGAYGMENLFGIRADNNHVNQWQWTPPRTVNGTSVPAAWINGDLTVTTNPGATLPQYAAITVADPANIYGIRIDNNNHMNQWQWVGDHTVNGTFVPAAWSTYDFAGPSLSAIKAFDANHVFGVRSDNGKLIEWVYTDAAGWTLLEVSGSSIFGILSPAGPSTVFSVDTATGDLKLFNF